jgi:hypothetical protein
MMIDVDWRQPFTQNHFSVRSLQATARAAPSSAPTWADTFFSFFLLFP